LVETELIIPVVNFDPVEITNKTAENVCNNLDMQNLSNIGKKWQIAHIMA
jgi:hypothetical protein